MEVEVRTNKDKSVDSFCLVEQHRIMGLKGNLEKIIVAKNSKDSPSKQIKDATEEIFRNGGDWRQPFQFDSSVSSIYPLSNYRLDAMIDEISADCEHSHRILVEQCFDNRQAIGTNLLKFQLASSLFENHLKHTALSIITCADRHSLKLFGWDGSIASSEEYEAALRGPYANIITANVVLMVIRD